MNLFRFAAHISEFCDLKNFYQRSTGCPIPTITKFQEDSSTVGEQDLTKLKQMNHPDSDKVLSAIGTNVAQEKGELGEYGFTNTSLYSVLGAIDSLEEDSEVKSFVTELIESKEGALADLDEDTERLAGWKEIFLEVKKQLEGKYGVAKEVDPELEKNLALVNHQDEPDSYKNEVPGCVKKGTCCIKCERLIDCPVPEFICKRVQNWALKTRGELAEGGGYEKSEEVPGFDPANIQHTREPVPSKGELAKKSPQEQEYYEKVKQRKVEEKETESNPYIQRAEELKLEESFPGIMEWYRGNWQWLLDLADKKIPEVDSEGNPTGQTLSFSDKEWQNINAPEIRQLLQNNYPSPSEEELKHYITQAQNKRIWHSEKGKSMEPQEIIDMLKDLPGLDGLGLSLQDSYKASEYDLQKPKPDKD